MWLIKSTKLILVTQCCVMWVCLCISNSTFCVHTSIFFPMLAIAFSTIPISPFLNQSSFHLYTYTPLKRRYFNLYSDEEVPERHSAGQRNIIVTKLPRPVVSVFHHGL